MATEAGSSSASSETSECYVGLKILARSTDGADYNLLISQLGRNREPRSGIQAAPSFDNSLKLAWEKPPVTFVLTNTKSCTRSSLPPEINIYRYAALYLCSDARLEKQRIVATSLGLANFLWTK